MIKRENHPQLGNASRPLIGGWIVPISNDNGGPFGGGGNGPPKGEPLRSSNNEHPKDQKSKIIFYKSNRAVDKTYMEFMIPFIDTLPSPLLNPLEGPTM